MPAPDVQYFLDGSVEFGHIAPDTHFYFMEVARDTNEVLDAYEDREPFGDKHSHRLADMGLYMEDRYVSWRADPQNRVRDRRLASFIGLQGVPVVLHGHAVNAASALAEAGFSRLNKAGVAMLDKHFHIQNNLQVARRALGRAAADLRGSTTDDLREMRLVFEGQIAANRMAEMEVINRVQQGIRCGDVPVYDEFGNKVNRFSTERDIKRAQKVLAERAKLERRVIKRSVKFFTKLVGNDATRVFVGGGALRIEGDLAIYEMKKMCDLGEAHGGFRALSVFDKDHPELHLCDICIYTDKVPLLDHIASLVMHIKAGEEQEILKVGNCRNASEDAYERDWLRPHLPERRPEGWTLQLPDIEPPWAADRIGQPLGDRDIEQLRRDMLRFFYEEVISDHAALVGKMRHVYRTLGPSEAARFAVSPEDIALLCVSAANPLALPEPDTPWIDAA